MEMRLYVVNVDGDELEVCRKKSSLTEKRIKGAESMKEILSRYHMDKVYSSSLFKAKERAEIFVPYLKAEIWNELDGVDKDSIRESMGIYERDGERRP